MKNKRTKICGIVSFVLFFIAFILLFMWLITCDTENEIDTFIQGLFFLLISLIFFIDIWINWYNKNTKRIARGCSLCA